MNQVYLIRQTKADENQLGQDALTLLQKVVSETEHTFAREIPIKVHFGEQGNKTFIPARAYSPIIQYLQANGVSPSYIETNVLYRGSRTTTDKHLATAQAHGFTQIPIVIADGNIGTEYDEIEINKVHFKTCKIGRGFRPYQQIIVMSHFKGHGFAGFGGAIKQLAMGFAARGGKLDQHSGIAPVVSSRRCIACGICKDKCNYGAIRINDFAVIDSKKCIGCAGCIAVCPKGAISNSWSGLHFHEKMAEYAYGAALGKNMIYITFIHNITEDCDCTGSHMKPITANIGIIAGKDPVALDTACLDLVQKSSGKKLFEDGRPALRHAEKIGLGKMAYDLIELA